MALATVAPENILKAKILIVDNQPSNVMLPRTSDGRITPRVIDFGIAKLFGHDEVAGSGATRSSSRMWTARSPCASWNGPGMRSP